MWSVEKACIPRQRRSKLYRKHLHLQIYPTESIYRTRKLLWQIPSWLVQHSSSTLSSPTEEHPMEVEWRTGESFWEVKSKLTSYCVLVHFDPNKELVLACDAWPYIRCGNSAVPSFRRRTRMSHCRDKEIPHVFVQSTFRNHIWSQATATHFSQF